MWQYSLVKLTGVDSLISAISLLRVLGLYLGWIMKYFANIKGFGGFHWFLPNTIQIGLPLEQLCKPL